MTQEQWADYAAIGKYEKRIDFLLYKLAEPGKNPPTLSQYTQYLGGQFVPPDKQGEVERLLKSEVRARELMGDAAYFGSRNIAEKIGVYDVALNVLNETAMKEGTLDVELTWEEFRRRVAVAVAGHAKDIYKFGVADDGT